MNFVNEWFLTFLVNSIWEIAAVVALAILCDRLLVGSSPSRRHALWVSALVLSFALPAATGLLLTWKDLPTTLSQPSPPMTTATVNYPEVNATASSAIPSTLSVSVITGLTIAGLYLFFVLIQIAWLTIAWKRTRLMSRSSDRADLGPSIAAVIDACCVHFKVGKIPVLFSSKVSSPVTIGTRRPVVILPDAMREETDQDLLVSAIGHELVHISRRDYMLNLLYEITLVPLSFHPAVRFVKRRIDHTRELCCDEVVTRQLINAEDYARSLVKLARSASVSPRQALTTVGMGNADDLEVRVMSLLKGSVTGSNAKYYLAGALLLAVGAGFVIGNLGFKVGISEVNAQETEKPKAEITGDKVTFVIDDKGANEGFIREWRAKLAAEHPEYTPEQVKQALDKELTARRERDERNQQQEAMDQAKLAREANVSMGQAIQVALASHPGIVIESRLVRERGVAMYRIVVLDRDSPDGASTFMLVSGQDGQIVKSETVRPKIKEPE